MEVLKLFIFLTLVNSLVFLKKTTINKYVILSLILANINNLVCFVGTNLLAITTNIYVLVSFVCWLQIYRIVFKKKQTIVYLFLIPALLIMVASGLKRFNQNIFILGSFVYIIMFLIDCIKILQTEHLQLFKESNFVLILAPILFYLAMTILFSFKDRHLNNYQLFYNYKLFDLIAVFANMTYYSLLNYYIYQNKKPIYDN